MPPVRTFGCLGEESACTTKALGVGLFGDSDCEYMKNSVPWKRKHRGGQLDCDADDHIYTEKLAAGEDKCTPLCHCFEGGCMFVIRPYQN